MERHGKKNMLETVAMLIEANDAVSKAVKVNPDGAAGALAQCQESAIFLGTYIEKMYGNKYFYIVKSLEDYCENIYQMNNTLSDDDLCRKWSRITLGQLAEIDKKIRSDIPDDKKEVVFLPYKASMWDSLESVWKAADADENTDAYVIPIPYFDKNPDGSFREAHYEGDQYPGYVPITRYDQYDFEKRMPDAIYIHNPYDNCNYVTSVHPFFYSKNLKKFTENLVYIPYFVLDEIKPDNQAAIEGMKHFCLLPGVFNADKVIVQSENMRQVYINVLTKESGNTEEVRSYWDRKILGLGSPKLDRISNMKMEDVVIPEKWKKNIYREDGTKKKIVFYNNSVTALLQSDGEMLKKMELVFRIFEENQNKIALLWRPHPLIESTLTSMRPQLWEEYRKIRDNYLEAGWGIYDDTPDIDRAILISDAYYGDPSSVVQMYQQTGKPIMIQNLKVGI